MEDLGKRIKEFRKANSLSMSEFSAIVKIPKDRIYKWEKGAIPYMTNEVENLIKILEIGTVPQIEQTNNSNIAVPVYDIEFTAGFQTIIRDQRAEVVNYINIPEVKGCDVVVRARGDSMADKICDKDWIGLKAVTDMSVLSYGHIYAIVTKDMELVKYVRKSKNEDSLLLKSHNPNYDDFELHKSKVLELYLVKTVIPIKTII